MLKWLDNSKSLRPRKSFQPNSKHETLHKLSKQSLGTSDTFIEAVKLPKGEKVEEWWAVHVIDFYNNLNLLVGPTEEGVKGDKSKCMKAGEWEYLFKNDTDCKKPKILNPYDYINKTMDYLEDKINDPKVFPEQGKKAKYPKDMKKIMKDIFKRMFRIMAYLLREQYKLFQKKGLMAHLNTILKHFLCFSFQFKLMGKKELVPLHDWILQNLPEFKKKLKKK